MKYKPKEGWVFRTDNPNAPPSLVSVEVVDAFDFSTVNGPDLQLRDSQGNPVPDDVELGPGVSFAAGINDGTSSGTSDGTSFGINGKTSSDTGSGTPVVDTMACDSPPQASCNRRTNFEQS